MKREWKPGDVAMVTYDGDRTAIAIYSHGVGTGCPVWESGNGYLMAHRIESIRPLVVIDPEDREQVERLRAAMGRCPRNGEAWCVSDHCCTERLTAGLRSLVAPPKPDEPTDPKARVTDRRENVWRLLADGDWVCTSGPDCGEYLVWWQLAERGPLTIEGVTR